MKAGDHDLMTDDEEVETERRWYGPGTLLTPEASAITAFTLAVLGILGAGFPAAHALVGLESPDAMGDHLAVSGMIALLLLLGTLWLGQRVLTDDPGKRAGWPTHLAGASVVIAAVGSVLAIVMIVGGLAAGSPSPLRIGS